MNVDMKCTHYYTCFSNDARKTCTYITCASKSPSHRSLRLLLRISDFSSSSSL